MPCTAYCALPPQSVVLPGIDEQQARKMLSESDLQPLEGIWYYPNEEMTLAIEKWDGEKNIGYRIILLASNDFDLTPGTVIGYIASSAVNNKYNLWLYSEQDRTTLLSPLQCVATLNADNNSLTFDPPHYNVKVRINFARFLPSIFSGGVSIYTNKVDEKLPIGFKKTYPTNGNGDQFNKVRYL